MKIVQQGNFDGDIISTVLNNRKIENLELFLNPEKAEESDPLELLNSDEARYRLLKALAEGKMIVILVDADADGFCSAAILYQYILDICPTANIHYIVHDIKAHGLTDNAMSEILEMDPDLVITPDAASNDGEKIERLSDRGIDVIVLDHHHVDEIPKKGVIVNNQICPVTNNRFVGAGVVYKFIQGIDEEYGYDYADNYLDLVAIGQIGDASDISHPEIRKLVLRGLQNINNPLLKLIINSQIGFKVNITPKDMSFKVIPFINAVTRVGSIEERELMFESLANICPDRIFEVEKKKKNKTTGRFDKIQMKFNLHEYVYDMLNKVKAKQTNLVKKITPKIEENIQDDTGVIIAFTPEDTPGISGLVANKLVSKFDKPALLLNEKEDSFIGSGRGHEKTMLDFRQWCENSGLVEFAQGHDNAFGIEIKKENIDAFKEYSREIEKQEIVYEVDLITDKVDKKHCEIIHENSGLFGGNVSEPLIGIVGLVVPKRFISLKGSVLNIYSWGVTCVKFNSHGGEFQKLMSYPEENVRINMVGTYGMNDWGGRVTPQFIIKDFEIIKIEEVTVDNIVF